MRPRCVDEKNTCSFSFVKYQDDSLGATDPQSGLGQMRFSNDGASWSVAEPYSSTKTSWDLSAYGGNSNTGTKTVFVKYGDAIGNGSVSFTDTIHYNPSVPQLSGPSISNGVFDFTLSGMVGSNYVIQASSNLLNWLPISTSTVPVGGSVLITDPNMTNQSRRFYRAVAQ
jgi:hypothetical protein